MGVKKYQGQVFARLQSFESNIKSEFPHIYHLFILKWAKLLADIYVSTSDGAPIIHMLFLKSWKMFNLKIWNPCFFSEFKSLMFEGRVDKTAWQRPEFEANNPKFEKKTIGLALLYLFIANLSRIDSIYLHIPSDVRPPSCYPTFSPLYGVLNHTNHMFHKSLRKYTNTQIQSA